MRYDKLVAILLAVSLQFQTSIALSTEQKPQYVLITFDGAHDNKLWDRALNLGEQTGARFTFFLSCVFLLSPETSKYYSPPKGHGAGRSNVGFAPSRDDVKMRLRHIWEAHQRGHEIASHGCGHFDGAKWSKAQWRKEIDSFHDIVTNAHDINKLTPAPKGWKTMARQIKGFRAPYLATNKALFSTLTSKGFDYDASTVGNGPDHARIKNGLTYLPIPMIKEGPKQRKIIAMDYNWFVRHSAAFNRPSQAKAFEKRTYNAIMASFEQEYRGKRHPVQAAFHFKTMNGGAYWNALEHFARSVCNQAQVRCVSMRQYLIEKDKSPDQLKVLHAKPVALRFSAKLRTSIFTKPPTTQDFNVAPSAKHFPNQLNLPKPTPELRR